jgi:phage portal protein BeeE
MTLNHTDWIEVTLVTVGIIAMTFAIPEILYIVVEKLYFHNNEETEFFTMTKKSEIFRSISNFLLN